MFSGKKCSGLTLTELITCIVVIGFLISAFYSGSSLYSRAKLNAVIEDFHRYDFAVSTFRQKYNYYPGDMPAATQVWREKTSNGDGNSKIGHNTINEPESYLAFQHLSLAGYIDGRFSGSGTRGTKIGVNTPKSPYRNLTTYWFYTDNLWGNYPESIGMFFSGIESEGYSDHRIKAVDAYFIDKKIDDYRPYTGKLITFSTKDGECVTSNKNFTNKIDNLDEVKYKVDDEDDRCSVFYSLKRNTLDN
ncbi:MAG: hypothetical protein PQ612_10740 [Rickettsiales bacterium]|nr:hypothetical protein [Pseudomonadota bacterium]MDA0966715.1 hypothetical protein [Pseudomonadota bacterium]MDG4544475.1 hypothetical protein [Rickettsiales bacterium]MDG4546627.1 hypothetical protein [Rickettsiales bacterium]